MKATLEELLDEHRFEPFVLTTLDGFSISIDSPRKTLLTPNVIAIVDKDGKYYHIPFTAIAHLSESPK
jgi:hypothetical protein